MPRYLFISFCITAGVYTAMLFAIGHPFVSNADQSPVSAEAGTSVVSASASEVAQDVSPNNTGKATGSTFAGPTIYGVSKTINMSNAGKDINALWQELQANKVLEYNVDWKKNAIRVYAYYHDFNSDFSQATLNLGYHGDDLRLHSDSASIQLPSGSFSRYSIDTASGAAGKAAWAQAYVQGNLIERYTLDSTGNITSAEAIVVTNSQHK